MGSYGTSSVTAIAGTEDIGTEEANRSAGAVEFSGAKEAATGSEAGGGVAVEAPSVARPPEGEPDAAEGAGAEAFASSSTWETRPQGREADRFG
ncbi:hypothetical protein V6N13_051252 [Hibiscus sabdariffa]